MCKDSKMIEMCLFQECKRERERDAPCTASGYHYVFHLSVDVWVSVCEREFASVFCG